VEGLLGLADFGGVAADEEDLSFHLVVSELVKPAKPPVLLSHYGRNGLRFRSEGAETRNSWFVQR
jgi:hypothetical protein